MKKFIALLCAGVLACSMSMMAFAAESQTTSSQTTSTISEEQRIQQQSHSTVADVRIWSAVIVDGQEVDGVVNITPASAEARAAAEAQAAAIGATILQVVEVNYTGNPFRTITIPFNLSNVVAGQNIVVLHQKHDGTWETITPDKVENGLVTVTFTSLSPVAFAQISGTAVKSPKTGDVAVPFVAVIAFAAVAGAAVAGKKAFN